MTLGLDLTTIGRFSSGMNILLTLPKVNLQERALIELMGFGPTIMSKLGLIGEKPKCAQCRVGTKKPTKWPPLSLSPRYHLLNLNHRHKTCLLFARPRSSISTLKERWLSHIDFWTERIEHMNFISSCFDVTLPCYKRILKLSERF